MDRNDRSAMDKWFPLRTPRLLLREFVATDEADVHEYGSDPEVCRYDVWGPNTPQQTRDVLARRLAAQSVWPRDEIELAVELPAERKMIGSLRLHVTDPQRENAEIGWVFHRAYWGNGYATEAASAVLDCAFGRLGLRRVYASCDVRNVGSWRVMEKLGMSREGYSIKDKLQKGEWRDSYLYAILAPDRRSKRV